MFYMKVSTRTDVIEDVFTTILQLSATLYVGMVEPVHHPVCVAVLGTGLEATVKHVSGVCGVQEKFNVSDKFSILCFYTIYIQLH